MKLWLIAQDQNQNYDTYDSAIVAAETEEDAKQMNPAGGRMDEPHSPWDKNCTETVWEYRYNSWCDSPEHVEVSYIGKAAPKLVAGVVLASFNGG